MKLKIQLYILLLYLLYSFYSLLTKKEFIGGKVLVKYSEQTLLIYGIAIIIVILIIIFYKKL